MTQHKLSYLVRYIILHHEYFNSLLCLGDNTPKNQYLASVYLECQASIKTFTWKFVVVQDLQILNTVSGAVMS